MARSASTSDRTIPHLRDIFWSGAPTAPVPVAHRTDWRTIRQDDVNELAYQFQDDARVRGCKSSSKDHPSSHHPSSHHPSSHHSNSHHPSSRLSSSHHPSSHHSSSHHHKQQHNDLGHDSAISVGSTSEDEHQAAQAASKKKCKKSRARDTAANARTLTEKDVKHLERHLSMKKTIRKKIMRDLQQAFVEDPTEFRVEDINSHEQLIQSLSFGTPSRHAARHTSRESNFLDMLRATDPSACAPACPPVCPPACPPLPRHSGGYDDQDSGHGSPRGSPRNSPTREMDRGRTSPPPQQQGPDDFNDGCHTEDTTGKKTSFWRRFTMKGKSKR